MEDPIGKATMNGDAKRMHEADLENSAAGPVKKPRLGNSDLSRLSINPAYLDEKFKGSAKELIKRYGENMTNISNVELPDKNVFNMIFRKPFRHMVFPDFFHGPIEQLEDEVLALKFEELNTDLFQLSQSKELSRPFVEEFVPVTKVFKEEIRPWLSELTGIDLINEVDMRAAVYRYTDRLVCHDDRLSTRKIAYIYYLTDPDWTAEDGGTLDLFDSVWVQDMMVPGEVAKSIVPKRNSLVLFMVSDDSFHQVSEVLNVRKPRVSLTGWFHGQQNLAKIEYREAPEPMSVEIFSVTPREAAICRLAREDDLAATRLKALMLKQFKKEKHAVVPHMFTAMFYHGLLAELYQRDRVLPWVVPTNRNESGYYQYIDLRPHVFPKEHQMSHLDLLIRSFLTEQFLQSLTDITAVKISKNVHTPALFPSPFLRRTPSGAGTSGVVTVQFDETWFLKTVQLRLERFQHKSYTLRTFEAVQQGDVLDLLYFIGSEKMENDCGGNAVYVDIEPSADPDPLYRLQGLGNTLEIVQRDENTVFYTDYVNHRFVRRNNGRPFYRLWMSIPAVDLADTAVQDGSDDDSAGTSSGDEAPGDGVGGCSEEEDSGSDDSEPEE